MQTVTYPYSKLNSLYFTLLCLAMTVAIFYALSGSTYDNSTGKIGGIAVAFCFCAVLIYLIVKTLIPAFTGKAALELNKDSLIYYLSNFTLNWKDVKKIELQSGSGTWKILFVTFKNGDNARLPLIFVAGRGSSIYEAIKGYVDVGC
jgi:hypothetical protein